MMLIQFLESRRLLSITVYTPNDLISVTTTSANDTVLMSVSAGNTLTVSINGVVDFVLGGFNDTLVPEIHISTLGGNDTINLARTTKPILSTCIISGGAGADTILSGAGFDMIFGGDGNDSIDGGLGRDTMSGGLGNDTVSYVNRTNAVDVELDLAAGDGEIGENDWVGAGTLDVESIMGGSGNDTLVGNASGNYISGGAGADNIHGGAGSDTIVGGAGMDSLYGDDDADFIFARDGEFDVIDGGAGIDSADVDSNPIEAPLPEAPVAAAAAAPVPIVSEKSKTPFSIQPIDRKPLKRAGVTRGKSKAKITATAKALAPASAPLPAPPTGYEQPIDPATLGSIVQPLDPYTEGQVLVTRDKEGTVNVLGTNRDDQFVIRSTATPDTVEIENDGGLTVFDLPSHAIIIGGIASGGNDSLEVTGPSGAASLSSDPSVPGEGLISAGGRNIIFNGAGAPPISTVLFSDLTVVSYVTPGAHDVLALTSGANGAPAVLQGTSDGVLLTTIAMNNVGTLALDTGANDNVANLDDQITVNSVVGDQLPILSLTPGSFGNDSLTVNGPLQLANNPRAPGAEATLTVMANSAAAQVVFLAPLTELAGLQVLAGSATIAAGGNSVLVTRSLSVQSVLDLQNNSLIVDYAQGAPPATPIVASLIQSAYQPAAATHWSGPGITSGIAATDSGKSLGYADSAALFGAAGATFMGVPVDASATLVTFTSAGDSNLDRTVGFADLVSVAQNYGSPGKDWLHGDFNFDGTADFADLVAVAQHYGQGLSFP